MVATVLLALVLAASGGGQAAPTTADDNQVEEAGTQEPTSEVEEVEEPTLPAIPADVTGGKPWMDSVVVGNVTADTQTSPVDDLYLYVNKDWIIAQKLPEGSVTLDFDKFAERLAYAAKQDSFDYKAFFEERARLQPSVSTAEYEQQWVYGGDRHPVAFLDTNVTVQQFDEFMDAFGVKEGDAMWLAPKDRLVVW